MGISDYFYSTADYVNRVAVEPVKNISWNSYSYFYSTADYVNRVAVEPVKNISWNSYSYIDRYFLKDPDAVSKMSQFATTVAKNAAVFGVREGIKSVPCGGPLYDIVSRSLPHGKDKYEEIRLLKAQSKDYNEKILELQAQLDDYKDKTKELQSVVNKIVQDEANFSSEHSIDCVSNGRQEAEEEAVVANGFAGPLLLERVKKEPEDLIRGFMMKGFLTHQGFDSRKGT